VPGLSFPHAIVISAVRRFPDFRDI